MYVLIFFSKIYNTIKNDWVRFEFWLWPTSGNGFVAVDSDCSLLVQLTNYYFYMGLFVEAWNKWVFCTPVIIIKPNWVFSLKIDFPLSVRVFKGINGSPIGPQVVQSTVCEMWAGFVTSVSGRFHWETLAFGWGFKCSSFMPFMRLWLLLRYGLHTLRWVHFSLGITTEILDTPVFLE